jgi:hypothetical protein
MAETLTLLRNTKVAIREETTEGTLIAEQAGSAVLPRADGISFNINRELLETGYMTGSLSKTAPIPGMYDDDLGWTLPVYARGKGTLAAPDWSVAMKSAFGSQNANTDDAIAAAPAPTTDSFTADSGSNDFSLGQLIRINSEITRIIGISGENITIWPPLSTTPSATDVVTAGINWQLSSTTWPTFSSYSYFDGDKRYALAGCRTKSVTMPFEVGARVPIDFGIVALTPTIDYTAQAVTPTLDTATNPPVCLGMDLNVTYAGTATGTPTTTETILSAPNFDVASTGDFILIDVGSGVWETVAITNASGNPSSNITLTHAAVSVAASNGDTVYVQRKRCAGIGDTLSVTLELEVEFWKCMEAASGKFASRFGARTVSLSKTPYFNSWSEFLLRDNVVGAELLVQLGDTAGNIFVLYMPNVINTEVSLTSDALMKVDVGARAVVGSTLGNDDEIVVAVF